MKLRTVQLIHTGTSFLAALQVYIGTIRCVRKLRRVSAYNTRLPSRPAVFETLENVMKHYQTKLRITEYYKYRLVAFCSIMRAVGLTVCGRCFIMAIMNGVECMINLRCYHLRLVPPKKVPYFKILMVDCGCVR